MAINCFDYTVEIKNDDKLLMSQTLDIKKDSFENFKQIINYGEMLIDVNESFFFYVQRGELYKFIKVSTDEELITATKAFCCDFLEQQEIAKADDVTPTQQIINIISEKILETTPLTLTEDEEENIDHILDFTSGDFSALGEISTPDGAFDAYAKIARNGNSII